MAAVTNNVICELLSNGEDLQLIAEQNRWDEFDEHFDAFDNAVRSYDWQEVSASGISNVEIRRLFDLINTIESIVSVARDKVRHEMQQLSTGKKAIVHYLVDNE